MPSTLSSSHWPKTERLPSLLRIVLVLMGFLPSALAFSMTWSNFNPGYSFAALAG